MHRFSRLLAAAASTCLLAAPAAAAQTTSPYQKGPAPTAASVRTDGPYAVSRISVSDASTPGFGSATISYPTSTADGTFGAVAVSPGFTASESTIAWYGPRLASHGFVVITFNTNGRFDQPRSRGTQLLAALDYLTTRSSVSSRIDASRQAVVGHSMGGGGTLEAAKTRPSLQATVGLTPWNTDKSWPEIKSPSLIIGAQNDTIAPVGSHSQPFYNSIPASTAKAYYVLAGASHTAPVSTNATISAGTVSWLKRFVDDDLRFDSILCPGLAGSTRTTVSSYSSNCTTWN